MADSETNASAVDVQRSSWEGYVWSEWHTLERAIASRMAQAPDIDGLYRLRCANQAGLIYIGETGKSLRGRFRQLYKAMEYAANGKSGGPPHVAGLCVWKHTLKGHAIEVSWVETHNLDRRNRKGVECELIAAYRKAHQNMKNPNPVCQFAGDLENEVENDVSE
jgi:hypothetical protein